MNTMLKALAVGAALGLCSIIAVRAQTQMQFPTTPWGGYAPATVQCGRLIGANMNTTADQAITISVPAGHWSIADIGISNPSISLSAAVGGFYTGAAKTGIVVVANSQAYSGLTTNTANTTGNFLLATLSTAGMTTEFGGYAQGANQISTLYFALSTPQSAAATADIRVRCRLNY